MHHLRFLIAVVLASLAGVSELQACSCVWMSGDGHYRVADAAFLGQVLEASRGERRLNAEGHLILFSGRNYLFWIEKQYKGLEGRSVIRISTGMGGGDCGSSFRTGKRYLIFVYGDEEGGYSTGICSGNRAFDEKSDLYRFLGRLDSGDHRSFISGRLDLRRLNPQLKKELKTLEVVLEGDGVDRSSSLASNGTFRFDDLIPGQYRLSIALPRHYDPQPLEESVSLGFPLGFDEVTFQAPPQPSGAIALPVLDVAGASSPLKLKLEGGEPSDRWVELDAAGVAQAFHLPPGAYRFSISFEGTLGRLVFPPPDVPGIEVSAGEISKPSAWRLPVTFVERVVQGRVLMPDESPAAGAVVTLDGPHSRIRARADDDGRFRLQAIEPLHYERLMVRMEIEEDGRMRSLYHFQQVDWPLDNPPNLLIRMTK